MLQTGYLDKSLCLGFMPTLPSIQDSLDLAVDLGFLE